ncbi:unnamed protein product, partial [Tenebrio molitor]
WPTSKIKQHHRSPPVPLPPSISREEREKAKNQGETVPSSDIRDGQQRHQGTQGTRRIVFQAIKFVAANYKSTPKRSPLSSKYLKGAVASGSLVQTKGKGASGSFQ